MTTLYRAYWKTPHGLMSTVPLPLKEAEKFLNKGTGGYLKPVKFPKTMKKNPRPRIGKAKATRASTATGKKASKRLIARRKRNGKKGFFPNPSKTVYYVADSEGGQGFSYGWDGITPIGWYVGRGRQIPSRGKYGRVTYGYLFPSNLSESPKFLRWYKENAGKQFTATRNGLKTKFSAMLE